MKYEIGRLGRSYNLLLDRGDDIQTEVQKTIRQEQITNGGVCAGLGGFADYGLSILVGEHGEEKDFTWANTILQLSSLQGILAQGSLELHSVVSLDAKQPDTFAGKNLPITKQKFYCQMMLWEIIHEESKH